MPQLTFVPVSGSTFSWACPVSFIVEVAPASAFLNLFPLPSSPSWLRGVSGFKGHPVTLVDLNEPPSEGFTDVLLLTSSPALPLVALVAGQVGNVFSQELRDVSKPSNSLSLPPRWSEVCREAVFQDGVFLPVLDATLLGSHLARLLGSLSLDVVSREFGGTDARAGS